MWKIALATADAAALHMTLLGAPGCASVHIWRKIHQLFPYRYCELPGQHDFKTTMNPMNLLNWLLTVPAACIGPQSVLDYMANRLPHDLADDSLLKDAEPLTGDTYIGALLRNPTWREGTLLRQVLSLRQKKALQSKS